MRRPEFSRPVAVDAIAGGGRTFELEAGPEERLALARRFGLLAIGRLQARLSAARRQGGRILAVEGEIGADVVQECVVTLDPVPAAIAEPVAELFAIGEGAAPEPGAQVEVDLDAPEPLEGDVLDLGEIAAQHLLLALDPYPRAPSAPLATGEAAVPAAGPEAGPFAKLAPLRRR